MVGRRERSQPQARPTINAPPAAAERQRDGADLDAQETCEQACGDSRGEEGDVGSVARAQNLPHLCGGALDVAGAADQRHDIADIDPGVGAQRSFAAHPRECTQENAARVVADAFDDFPEGPAVKLAIVDQHLNYIAGDRPQNLVSIDLVTDDGFGGDNSGGRTGDDDVVAFLENRVQMRLDIGALADNSLDDGSAADLVFNHLDGSARANGHAIGSRLKLAIG
jgi:hypothetical protein